MHPRNLTILGALLCTTLVACSSQPTKVAAPAAAPVAPAPVVAAPVAVAPPAVVAPAAPEPAAAPATEVVALPLNAGQGPIAPTAS